jgi:hypothetical protein
MKFDSTLLQYLNEVKRKLGIPADVDNTEWSDNLITDLIHDARLWFWNKAHYQGRDTLVYISSVADQRDYSLSLAGITKIKQVSYNRGDGWTVPLDFYPLQDFRELDQTVESGDPLAWTVRANYLLLYPRPSTAVTSGIEIDGLKVITALEETTDTDSDIETDYRPIIVRYTTGLCWLEAEQENKANIHFSMAEKLYDDNAFEINSRVLNQNNPNYRGEYIDETNERHYSRPIG